MQALDQCHGGQDTCHLQVGTLLQGSEACEAQLDCLQGCSLYMCSRCSAWLVMQQLQDA